MKTQCVNFAASLLLSLALLSCHKSSVTSGTTDQEDSLKPEISVADKVEEDISVPMEMDKLSSPKALLRSKDGVSGGRAGALNKSAAPSMGYSNITHNESQIEMESQPQPTYNTESYSLIRENDFLAAKENPLSTFSIDVDAASYSNTRRFLNDGNLPPADAVRIEEFINYFDYQYPQPKGADPFSFTTEISSCPWNTAHRLVHIGMQGKRIPFEQIDPMNLVFLIDVSGSMEDANKLPLLKKAFTLLTNKLRSEDKVAIVVYAGAAGLVLPSTSGDQKATITDALNNLQAGGSTSGGEGIKLAYKIAKENFIENGLNRVIIATDGDFNIGSSSDAEMTRLIEERRDENIYLTSLGFGMGNYKDSKMESIADHGNGNYFYIDNIDEARKVLVTQLDGTLYTIAKDVKLQVEFNAAKVKAYRLVGYENRMLKKEDFNNDKKDAGELGAGHTVTALYEIIPAGSNEVVDQVDPLRYTQKTETKTTFSEELMTIKFRYKKPKETVSKLIEAQVKDQKISFAETSDNFRFSAAVASFGMVLRDSKFKGTMNYETIISLANGSKGKDEEGYRAEFIKLVRTSSMLNGMAKK